MLWPYRPLRASSKYTMMPHQNKNACLPRILMRPIAFSQPHRLVAPSSWEAHIPFAFWIIDVHRPAFLVELGTYSGNSYCAFLQAIKELGISCRCFSIDTWEGDKHSGFYGKAVFEDLSAYHDAHYSDFSRLVRSRFDDARNHFRDNSIDLLHIDGLHTYEAVKHDFDTWLPKMSSRGVILIHDSNVREADFGVWQLWEKVRKTYPHFTFTHGHGLGIAGVGKNISPELKSLFRLSVQRFENEETQLRSFFARLGNTFAERLQVKVLRENICDQDKAIEQVQCTLSQTVTENSKLKAALEANDKLSLTSEQDDLPRRAQVANEIDAMRERLSNQDAEIERIQRDLSQTVTENSKLKAELETANDQFRMQISEPEDALRRAQEALAQHTNEIDTMREGLSGQDAEIERIQRDLSQSVTENSKLKAELETANDQFRMQISEREDALRRAQEALAQHTNEIDTMRERLSGQDAKIEQILRDLSQTVTENSKLKAELETANDQFRQTVTENSQLKLELQESHDRLRIQISEERDALWRAQHALAQHTNENHDMRRRLSTRDAEIEQIQRALSQAVAENSRLKTELQAAKHEAMIEREEIDGLKLQLLAQMENNRLLRDSRSWRATAPLRFAHRAVRRIVKHPTSVPLAARWVLSRSSRTMTRGERNLEIPEVGHIILTDIVRDENVGDFVRDFAIFAECQSGSTPLLAQLRLRSATRDHLQVTVPVQPCRSGALLQVTNHSDCANREDPDRTSLKVSPIVAVADVAHSLPSLPNNPKLFCLCHVAPWPPRAGNEYRIHRMLTWATRIGWDVFLLVAPLPGQEPDAEQIRRLCSVYPNVVVACLNGHIFYSLKQGGDALSALNGQPTTDFANLLGEPQPSDPIETWALDFQRTMASDVLITVLQALVQAIQPKVVLANYVFMTRALAQLPQGVLKVLDTHDVFSTKQETVERFGIADKSISTEIETRLLGRADVIIAIQSEERAILSALAPGKTVITAGVDFDFTPLDSSPEGRSILFVASGNSINVKGAHDFLRFAWPLVQRKVGDAELLVCGSVGESIKVNDPKVRILGHVEDLTPLYSKARVVINPAVAGTGLKIKTIEAIVNLRPIVLWPLGASGLDPELKFYCTIAKNWYEFSVGVVEHLLDDTAIAKLRQNQNRLRELISAENVYSELAKVLGQPC